MSSVGSSRSAPSASVARSSSSSALDAIRRAGPAFGVLACTLLLTLGAWRYARETVRADEQERFDRIVAMSREAIDRRLDSYVQVLLGVRALFAGSAAVDRAEFSAYVGALDLPRRDPGIRGLAWAPRVPAAARAQHEAAMRQSGLSGYEIHPVSARSEYHPVVFVEPAGGFEEGVLGLDVAAWPENQAAMDRARDSGRAAMSDRLARFRAGGGLGFMIFMPVYRDGRVPDPLDERARDLAGFVAMSFRPDLMMGALLGSALSERMSVEIYDANEPTPARLLYDRDPDRDPTGGGRELSETVPLQFGGHTWSLRLTTRPPFHSVPGRLVPYWVLGSGVLISVLAFVITLLETRALLRARRLGEEVQAAERRMRQANERFELAAAAVSSAIYDRNLTDGSVAWTQGLAEMSGYDREEITPTAEWWLERLHPDDRPRIEAQLEAAAAGARDFEAEYRFRARDGRYLDILDRGRFVRDERGRPARMVGSLVDVSERKRAEAVLRESEARHRAVLESAMDAFVGMDHEGRITEFNPAAERLFGRTRDEVLGLELASVIIPPAFRKAHRRGLARYLATGQTVVIGGRLEVSALRADGREFPVELTVTRAGTEERPAFNAYIRDLTAQKQAESARSSLEAQLQQSQKMEAIGRLAGGVAHDFNNMLTVISGRAYMLLSRLKPGEPMHRDVELIQKTSQRAVALTSQLLAFSRKQVVQPRVLELGPLMSELGPMLQRMIGEDVELSVLPMEGTGRVKVDPSQMQQVVMNLAVNARDAMPGGGRITIAVRDEDVTDPVALGHASLPPGRYVTLAVSDSGTGMSPDTVAHIFEPFFTTKEQGKGTGLGLSTVYGIVEQSLGFIRVESELGRGTTFTIYLPRVDEPVPPRGSESGMSGLGAEPGRRRRTTARTVLVVDDEPEVLELATEILGRVGYRVLEAADGPSAIEVARRHGGDIHLLVTDMVMPGMSGRDLADRLRALRTTLPVLYTSGFVQDASARAAFAAEHSAFVAKPFTPELLADRVRELLAADAEAN
ncbi:MAG TPA: CHASE domain-containing protein [Methylomirabilota bacterium]|jgi:hypothetical protein